MGILDVELPSGCVHQETEVTLVCVKVAGVHCVCVRMY